MTIALDAVSATNTFDGNNNPKTASLVLGGGSNRVVVAGISINNGTAFVAVTFNGVAMTQAVTVSNGTLRSYIYYILEADLPAAGTYNLGVTPGAASRGGIWCVSLTGVKQAAPEATGSGQSSSPVSAWTSNITTLTNDAWCVDCVEANDRTFTADAGQTERVDFKDSTLTGQAGSTKPVVAAGATTLGWAPNTSSPYAHVIAAFAPAGWANIIKINGIASASVAKVHGIVVADIAKVNGVSV